MTVFSCDTVVTAAARGRFPRASTALWHAAVPFNLLPQASSETIYGRDDYRLVTQVGSAPIEPGGCYLVVVSTATSNGGPKTGRVGLRLEADGTAMQMREQEFDRVFLEPSRRTAAEHDGGAPDALQ